jgi:hypothetical protein
MRCISLALLLSTLLANAQNWAVWHIGPNTNGIPTNFPVRVEDIGTNAVWPGSDQVVAGVEAWRFAKLCLMNSWGLLPQSKVEGLTNALAAKADANHTHEGGASLPAGIIVMWSGALASVPSGWALCDGANGTPDLRDRFIKGWSQGVAPGGTGGSPTHTPAGTVSAPTFTGTPFTDVINHTHVVTITDPGHAHVQGVNSATTGGLSGYTPDTSSNTRVNSGYSTSSSTTGISATTANPAGGVNSITPAGTVSAPTFTGTQATIEPSYFKLAFIMKL